jgi:hypothetical protein
MRRFSKLLSLFSFEKTLMGLLWVVTLGLAAAIIYIAATSRPSYTVKCKTDGLQLQVYTDGEQPDSCVNQCVRRWHPPTVHYNVALKIPMTQPGYHYDSCRAQVCGSNLSCPNQ